MPTPPPTPARLFRSPERSTRPRRKNIRWADHDYAGESAYLITICTKDRRCILAEINEGEILLTGIGTTVVREWHRSELIRDEVTLAEFVVMPNHLHGIVFFRSVNNGSTDFPGVERRGLTPKSLGGMINGFKGAVTRAVRTGEGLGEAVIWQAGYHDRVLRNDDELRRARAYVLENPARWSDDEENPRNWLRSGDWG